MKYYYYEQNGVKCGPFTVEELKDKRLSKRTLMWTDGLENWVLAYKINEIEDLLVEEPPPLIKQQTKSKNIRKIKSSIIIAIPLSLLLAYGVTMVALEPDADQGNFPIYLTNEEKETPSIFFFEVLPYYYVFILILLLIKRFIFSSSSNKKRNIYHEADNDDDVETLESEDFTDVELTQEQINFLVKYNIKPAENKTKRPEN